MQQPYSESSRNISFAKAINEAQYQAMARDENVIVFGLGADDPRGVFGTTLGLQETFGRERVFDIPASENAMTGVAIGASLKGIRPIMISQRADFFLLAMDQLINNAAKWHYMFNGHVNVPITIRLIIGRGWGQGPTHSQNFHSLFAQIPGLKIVMPSTAADAKSLLLTSIFDDDPVVFLEHRWLHNTQGYVSEAFTSFPLGKGNLLRTGDSITLVSMSLMTIEAIRAVDFLQNYSIHCDLIDLRTIRPFDWPMISKSICKTGKLLVIDNGHATGSIAGEIIARASMELFDNLKVAPQRLAMPDIPEPTSFALTKNYHVRSENIVQKVAAILNRAIPETDLEAIVNKRTYPHDVPDDWFHGPF